MSKISLRTQFTIDVQRKLLLLSRTIYFFLCIGRRSIRPATSVNKEIWSFFFEHISVYIYLSWFIHSSLIPINIQTMSRQAFEEAIEAVVDEKYQQAYEVCSLWIFTAVVINEILIFLALFQGNC